MEMPETLFSHLASRFAASPEDLATEALSFVLSLSATARLSLQNFANSFGLNLPQIIRFETQLGQDGLGIPDLTGFDEQGHKRLVIEAKFGAGLTESQPVGYVDQLSVPGPSIVLFIVPQHRIEVLWPELLRRLRNSGKVYELMSHIEAPAARTIDGRWIAITSWRAILQRLLSDLRDAREIAAAENVRQLEGLCERMDAEIFIPLRVEEISNSEIPRRVINFSDLVWKITEQLQSDKKLQDVWITNDRHAIGRRFRMGDYIGWIGVEFGNWMKFGQTPIWIGFQHNSVGKGIEVLRRLAKFQTEVPPRVFRSDDWTIVPIRLLDGAEEPAVFSHAIAQLEELRMLLQA